VEREECNFLPTDEALPRFLAQESCEAIAGRIN
jgi:hypothetical protein